MYPNINEQQSYGGQNYTNLNYPGGQSNPYQQNAYVPSNSYQHNNNNNAFEIDLMHHGGQQQQNRPLSEDQYYMPQNKL